MASIILSAAGSAVGASTGLPFGATIGGQLGRSLGGMIDNKLFGKTSSGRHGSRLADLGVQSSTYGKMIPILYGTLRIGGNIIWSLPIKETVITTTSSAGGGGGKGGGGKVSQSSTSYSYSVTLAVGVCEGEVNEVLRIWADALQLDNSQYTIRIYTGSEDQMPDSLIQATEGSNKTPAHRGMCYVVFEDFPLADFGNRIPNFTFEVNRKMLAPDYNGELLEDMIKGVVMIPGAGEFVYDTQAEYKIPGVLVGSDWVQQGDQQQINTHTPYGKANALVSLDQLAATCPNVEWISVVVAWFGNSIAAASCVLLPGVEYQTDAITSPDSWQVAGLSRSIAHLISTVGGVLQYGGTPADDSITRYLDELRNRGYKIIFYPLIFMDVSGKPWRGDLTGSAGDVSAFFTKTNGYNAFVTHYANLVSTKVDAFVIGSELKGLTKVTDTTGSYPGVSALVSLAASVRSIVGSGVKLTYAADWSEYHHDASGWYNLDPLWASPNIDMIGIDAYFPLTDAPQAGYDVDTVKAGWTSGEGYDWYYTDPARTTKANLTAPYAWKNLAWFWNNTHTNPDASTTAWVPNSKKIWFMEYGFPSVDGATNQPNVFYDPTSSASAFPYHSRGRVDFRAQRVGLVATEQQWKTSSMVERMFVWTWDARPYPYWPDLLSVWSDGNAWKTGHWVQGKLGISSVAAIIVDLCLRAGLTPDDFDASKISDQVEGYIVTSQQTIRSAIETLQQGYFFDSVESDNVLKFVPRGGDSVMSIDGDNLVATRSHGNNDIFSITRAQEIELPKRVNLIYINRLLNYQSSAQYAQREVTASREVTTLDLPIVLPDQLARSIADITLFTGWIGRTSYHFELPVSFAQLEPADVVIVNVDGVAHRMRITSTRLQAPGLLSVQAVCDDRSTYDFYTDPGNSNPLLQEISGVPVTRLELLDLPPLPAETNDKAVMHLAGVGTSIGWTGAAIYRSDDNGANYSRLTDINTPAVIGTSNNVLASGPTDVFDDAGSVTILLTGIDSALQSVTELAVLNGANAALLGNEVIQFKTATLIAPGQYTLGGLLRGRLGTEWAMGTHAIGDRFILLDGRLTRQTIANNLINLPRLYKPVTFGGTLSSAPSQSFTYSAIALKPFSPVQVAGTRDGGQNLTINWVRRTRIGGDWQDGVDVPLGEESERYEVDIMSGSTVARTISGLITPTASYSATDQTADFGSPQSSVTVKIYQLSALVGRGYGGVAAV